MKSTMTDQELIDAGKPALGLASRRMKPEHFTPEMLQSMRGIADAALEKFVKEPGFTTFPPPTRSARLDYETMLRDDFARTALICVEGSPQKMALMAYEIADAMLEVRNANR